MVFLFVWFLFTVLVSLFSPCFAAGSVGVKTGDWVKYQGSASDLPSGEFLGIDEMDWMKAEVTSVSGSAVTVQMTARYKNGSEMVQNLVGDVVTGSGNLTFLILPAGIERGDAVPFAMFNMGQVGMVVNDTVSRTYLGASRTVNALSLSVSQNYASVDVHAYWDKATGFLMELSMQVSALGQNMQLSIQAVETSMWSADSFGFLGGGSSGLLGDNLIYIVGIVAVVVIVVAAVLLMRTRKHVAPVPQVVLPPASAAVFNSKAV